jgi:hypothetical protein
MNIRNFFAASTPEVTYNRVRLAIFAIVVLLSLALPEVAFAYPTGGGVGG